MNVDVDGLRAAAESLPDDAFEHKGDCGGSMCGGCGHCCHSIAKCDHECDLGGGCSTAIDTDELRFRRDVVAALDRLQAAEAEVTLLHEIRDMDWDADAPMPESNTPEWGTEDYRRHAVLFNDITHAQLNARLMFSDRLRLQRTLWALGWRRDVRPEDVTEKADDAPAKAPVSASGAESDHGDRREGEGLACACRGMDEKPGCSHDREERP